MPILSLGKGVRGCTPFEFEIYYDKVVYLKCQACSYEWIMSLNSYNDNPPNVCPLCNEFSYQATWMIYDSQTHYYKHFPNLNEYQLIAVLPDPNIKNLIYGEPGEYIILAYLPGAILPTTGNTGSTGSTGSIDTGGKSEYGESLCSSTTSTPIIANPFNEEFISIREIIVSNPEMIYIYEDQRIDLSYPIGFSQDMSYHNVVLDWNKEWYDCGYDETRDPRIISTGETGSTGSIHEECEAMIAGSYSEIRNYSLFTNDVITNIENTTSPYPGGPVKINITTDVRDDTSVPVNLEYDLSGHVIVYTYNNEWHDCGIITGETGETGSTGSTGSTGDPSISNEAVYTILALINDPYNIEEEEMFHRNMLKVPLNKKELSWKKAYIYRDVKQNTIIG